MFNFRRKTMPFSPNDYETIAASQTDQILGPGTSTTKTRDYLKLLVIVPATTSPGNVLIQDGDDGEITIFTGGASSVATLDPIIVPIEAISVTGSWSVTTGANVSVLAVGRFT